MHLSIGYKNASKWGFVVLLTGLMLSSALTWLMGRINDTAIEQALHAHAEQVSQNVINRITLYQYGLRGARGTLLTAGEHNISREIFHRYSLTRDVDEEFPGARGFGFIRRVALADEADFVAKKRQADWPDFSIRHLNPNSGERYVIELIEPVERNKAAVGLDIASEAHRKAAADEALRSAEVRLTAPITLVQATGQTLQSFLILQPVYRTASVPKTVAGRLAAGFGWSYAPLVTNEVLTGLALEKAEAKLVLTDVTQADHPIHFFETHSINETKATHYRHTLTKPIFGRQWQIEVIAYPTFIASLNLNRPSLVFLSGCLFSALLAALITIWSLSLQRKQQILAEQARRASMLEHSLDGIISFDTQGIITSWNQGAIQLFGYSEAQALGQRCDLIVPPNRLAAEQVLLLEVLAGKSLLNRVSSHQRQDGSELSTSSTTLPIFDEDGAIVGLSQTIRDITAQLDAERNILNLNASLEQKVTKRTRDLQQALLENQTLLDTINQQLLYSVTDLQGIIQEVNDNFCYVSGYARSQLEGQTYALLKSGEHSSEFWRDMWTQIKSGQSWHGEICNRDCQQTLKWFDTVIGPVFDQFGQVERFVALQTDITERKLVQIEKNKLGHLLSHVLHAASEMSIIATDEQGIITIFNRGAERLLGYSAEEMVGISTPAPLHVADEVIARSAELSLEYGEDIQGFDVFVHKAKVEGSETRRWSYVRKDGSHCQVSLSVTAMRDNDDAIIGFLGIAVDISQMLQQQEALLTATHHLTKAADVAQLGIWTWDLSTQTLEWNDRMFEMYDQPKSLREQGVTFEHWSMRVHPDDLALTSAKLAGAVSGADQYDPTFRVIATDGSIRYVQAAAQVERDKQGKALRLIGINRDITEQRRIEATLTEAKNQADAANAAKSVFLANMSHEIRTPMNAVLGMLQLIQHTALSSQQQDYVSKIQIAAKSLLGLLNDILDFSKIEAGKLTLDPHPCSIEGLMRDLAVVLSGNHGSEDVEVMFDLEPSLPPWLLVDQLRLQQVLVNLAGNALKFTRHGQVIVAIKLLNRDAAAVTVQISVFDTGIGISEEQIERIFTGFEQAESSTSRRFGGSGLGLAISKKLVELMGGDLQVSSELGVGSRFWFDITCPIIQAEAAQPINLAGYRILVVDDNPLTAKILHGNLMGFGCDVEMALGGYQALEQVKQADEQVRPFDVVVMDWRMPELDGLQTAEMLKKAHYDGHAPLVVMLTAYRHEVITEENRLNMPVACFITKPVTSLMLAEAVLSAIEGDATTVDDAVRMVKPAAETQQLLLGLTVLVVEDNQLNRQVVDELLRHEGATVVLAEGGLEGVERVLCREHVFDIVIMDMQMPDIDGLEATRRIRADGRFNELPILAMTANASAADRQLCLNAGMDDHVGKPIDMSLLLLSILRLVGRGAEDVDLVVAQPDTGVTDADDGPLMDDFDLILRRFGNNPRFFQEMAKHFNPEMLTQLNGFKQAVQAADYVAAAGVSHTIKGVASNFGAKRLAIFAAYLEKQFKHASPDVNQLQCWGGELETLMQQSQQQLSVYLNSLAPESDELTPAIAQASPMVQQDLSILKRLLQDNNLEAMAFIDRLTVNQTLDPQWVALCEQVQTLDFERALASLKIIMAEEG